MATPKQHRDVKPRFISNSVHKIERAMISSNAIEVIDVLQDAGFTGELVGGCIRDLLIGRQPKDFDVATDARPDQVRHLFRHCEVFGRRFKIAQVRVKGEPIQVATYRRSPQPGNRRRRSKVISAAGAILKDNEFGNIREDAFRRDLTINSLYMDPSNMRIVDYTGGYEDACNGIVRVIGEPGQRYREDPVRLLRAIRFVTLPGFRFDAATEKAIKPNDWLLAGVSNFRLFDELIKILFNGRAQAEIEQLIRYGIFRILFPSYGWLQPAVQDEHGIVDWMRVLFNETDLRTQSGEHTSVAYTFAAVLWPRFKHATAKKSKHRRPAYRRIARGMLNQQKERTFLAEPMMRRIEDAWLLQRQLENASVNERPRISTHRNFRSAVRLLELRCRFGEVENSDCQDWLEIRDQQGCEPKRRRKQFRRRGRRN